ncbi:hypothetical protein [Anaerocolumna sp.]|uniref:hypothetical protein n=1 Tax=Anaerocolumna sp. TaxID=2041569 RepID=UPI002F3EBF47
MFVYKVLGGFFGIHIVAEFRLFLIYIWLIKSLSYFHFFPLSDFAAEGFEGGYGVDMHPFPNWPVGCRRSCPFPATRLKLKL